MQDKIVASVWPSLYERECIVCQVWSWSGQLTHCSGHHNTYLYVTVLGSLHRSPSWLSGTAVDMPYVFLDELWMWPTFFDVVVLVSSAQVGSCASPADVQKIPNQKVWLDKVYGRPHEPAVEIRPSGH